MTNNEALDRWDSMLASGAAVRREEQSLTKERKMQAKAYVTYMLTSGPSNGAGYHAGIGDTREESREAATYWANQLPWVKTVPISRAPRWAVDEAEQAEQYWREVRAAAAQGD